MEQLVTDLIKNHVNDKNLSNKEIQEEVRELREIYNNQDSNLDEDEQLVGLDWSDGDLSDFNFNNVKLSLDSEDKNANFRNTKLINTKFKGSTLIGAHFENADLTNANFEDSDLTNIWHNHETNFNKTILNNSKLYSFGLSESEDDSFVNAKFNTIDESNIVEAIKTYHRMENFYKIKYKSDRLSKIYFRRKRLETRIYFKKIYSPIGIKSKWQSFWAFIFHGLIELFSGYFERPKRVLLWWIANIGISTIIYILFGGPVGKNGLPTYSWWDSLYFSIVTFTTLGFGDLSPNIDNIPFKIVASGEALFGAFLMALFVVVLARKMTR